MKKKLKKRLANIEDMQSKIFNRLNSVFIVENENSDMIIRLTEEIVKTLDYFTKGKEI